MQPQSKYEVLLEIILQDSDSSKNLYKQILIKKDFPLTCVRKV